MSWTDERVELLRKLWSDGLSASQIAGELAHGVTRNAVIGKVHRLGLAGRVKTSPDAEGPRAPKAVKPVASVRAHVPAPPPAIRGALAFAITPRMAEAGAARAVVYGAEPAHEPVGIMDLRESTCRWPVGDPSASDFRYCGGDAPIGEGPYCRFHARMAYQPTQRSRLRS